MVKVSEFLINRLYGKVVDEEHLGKSIPTILGGQARGKLA
jgi:hypothetical protein